MIRETPARRVVVALLLLAPCAFVVPQLALIPSWNDASQYVAGALLVLDLGAVVLAGAWLLRRRGGRLLARVAVALGLVLVLAGGAFATWVGGTREGVLLCGRDLEATVDCPGGGQAFEFVALCVAGNPTVEVELRPGALPFMHRVTARSAADACRSH